MSNYKDVDYDSIRDYISLEEEPDGDYVVLRTYKTPTQRIALVEEDGELLIYSNGHMMFGTTPDERRFAEAMVHAPMLAARNRKKVLIIGGGGGITTREVLLYSDVEKVVTLDIDKEMVYFGKKLKGMVQFNNGSLNHPKVQTIIKDGRKFLENNTTKWDVIIVDLPEPTDKNPSLSRLFSVEFYSLIKSRLKTGGAISVGCSTADTTPEYLWSVYKTLFKAGFNVFPYHYFEPEDGEDWLFCLATTNNVRVENLSMITKADYLTTNRLRDMFRLPYYLKINKNTGKVQTDQNTVLIDITNRVF
ncbi:spermidine synthase [Fredinandcohnia onubensis]|uniref:spermidine synthase n=1 Tax=Fredinandcohnia onubensis TaxID=1571209 RepID=UPI000C0C0F94|nr:spermidine synthase [Fredinandcohnia onubensis]